MGCYYEQLRMELGRLGVGFSAWKYICSSFLKERPLLSILSKPSQTETFSKAPSLQFNHDPPTPPHHLHLLLSRRPSNLLHHHRPRCLRPTPPNNLPPHLLLHLQPQRRLRAGRLRCRELYSRMVPKSPPKTSCFPSERSPVWTLPRSAPPLTLAQEWLLPTPNNLLHPLQHHRPRLVHPPLPHLQLLLRLAILLLRELQHRCG